MSFYFTYPWLTTGHRGHKWFYPRGDLTTHLLLFNNGKSVCIKWFSPIYFSTQIQELERPVLPVCISVWLSPSLGLRSHPPNSVLFPFIIFSLLRIFAWICQSVWLQKFTGMCHRGPKHDGDRMIVWHLHSTAWTLRHFCHWCGQKKIMWRRREK